MNTESKYIIIGDNIIDILYSDISVEDILTAYQLIDNTVIDKIFYFSF